MAKILLVDDSNLSRRMLRAILEPEGHELFEASDGLTAIESYLLNRPDLVLLDLVMTGMTGLETLEKIREFDSGARIVIATADLQTLTRDLVEAAGAHGMINKPFNRPRVLEAVNSVLKGVSL